MLLYVEGAPESLCSAPGSSSSPCAPTCPAQPLSSAHNTAMQTLPRATHRLMLQFQVAVVRRGRVAVVAVRLGGVAAAAAKGTVQELVHRLGCRRAWRHGCTSACVWTGSASGGVSRGCCPKQHAAAAEPTTLSPVAPSCRFLATRAAAFSRVGLFFLRAARAAGSCLRLNCTVERFAFAMASDCTRCLRQSAATRRSSAQQRQGHNRFRGDACRAAADTSSHKIRLA